ncbi:hypothetical protein NLI96_g12403 [Meripilus lineatus]|uniref:glutathione transferase n=1 Tax=Meripilus lineatus TaxID=2056292 RepID=A0AAD5UPZ0_9APHY|nr:hypothetical protein NLI96_g12403 [Physisporinus lineatus]
MSHGRQFTLYSHAGGPNAWKPAMLLSELGLTYETIYLDIKKGEHKTPGLAKYNPNGRLPVLIDHANNGFTIWESNAILLYLVGKYDKQNKFSVAEENDKYSMIQWLFFQASGQGPYFGQFSWFTNHHEENIPSAIERYTKEVNRIWAVLESVLSKQEWLVGNKYTIADLSFITWNNGVIAMLRTADPSYDFGKQFPAVAAWRERMNLRPAVSKVRAIRDAVVSAGSTPGVRTLD